VDRKDHRSAQVKVQRGGACAHDTVLRESPLRVGVAARGAAPIAAWSTLRTPGHDLDLALGWCVAEGLVRSMNDVVDVQRCTDADGRSRPDDVTVRLATPALPTRLLAGTAARTTSTAACGLCGRDDLHALLDRCPPAPRTDVHTSLPTLAALLVELELYQPLHAATGGAHAAALGTADGQLLQVREDVGRHNAVDAVVGAAVRGDQQADVLLLSGRAGFELVSKAVAARVAVVAAVGAATDLAVATAQAAGITLVAFVGRSHGGTVLTHPDRLGLDMPALGGPR
jgi:FdhD protein